MKSLLIALALLLPVNVFADSSALILRGVAGDDEHAEKFTKWTDETRKALVDKFGFSADRVTVLDDKMTADEDKDQKISVWEAFKYASAGVDRFYKEEGRLVTEHPQISDNGAEKTNAAAKEVPQLARTLVFQVDRPIVTNDPKLAALLNEKKDLEQKIEALRIGKSGIPEPEYEKQMEDLLVQLALKNQQI